MPLRLTDAAVFASSLQRNMENSGKIIENELDAALFLTIYANKSFIVGVAKYGSYPIQAIYEASAWLSNNLVVETFLPW